MRTPIALCLMTLALAACQTRPAPAVPAAAVPAGAEDTCHAQDYAWLVGQDFSKPPPAAEGKVIRVVCSTCPMTMDYNAGRVNVIYDATSGKVAKLTCG